MASPMQFSVMQEWPSPRPRIAGQRRLGKLGRIRSNGAVTILLNEMLHATAGVLVVLLPCNVGCKPASTFSFLRRSSRAKANVDRSRHLLQNQV